MLGETGVGKEVVTETIHKLSPRRDRPLLKLSCAALSESLVESELFGHEQGAFTGAARAKPGLLETAEGGTVFLDEVGEMPPAIQAKLLRVLEDRQTLRVGGLRPQRVDVRFLSATNHDLEDEVSRGSFRRDLYCRLAGAKILIPPLRERVDEIDGLAGSFLAQLDPIRPKQLSAAALALLRSQPWPGNIRELRNVVERAALVCAGDLIEPEHLALEVPSSGQADGPLLRSHVAEIERKKILDALDKCRGNQTRAAKLLGISRGKLVSRIEQYGLPRPRKT